MVNDVEEASIAVTTLDIRFSRLEDRLVARLEARLTDRLEQYLDEMRGGLKQIREHLDEAKRERGCWSVGRLS